MEYGLIGEKLGHSFSKIIHEKLANYQYELKEINKEELDIFFKEKNFKAINVTIPYKEVVIHYLDEIDESVKLIGSCNTIVNKNGKLIGYNTDILGLEKMIEKQGINLKNKKVLILGHGGASLACLGAARHLGAKIIKRSYYHQDIDTISYDELKKPQDFEIIFNATPVGMYPNNYNQLIDLNNFNSLEAYLDCVYNPFLTLTCIQARERNIKACGGLYMLVAQAYYAVEYFLDKKLDLKLIDQIYNELIKEKDNIILIGMPSSGKTSVGSVLEKELGKKFVDLDQEIEKKICQSIKDYINKFGEESFRNIEKEVVKEIAKRNNQIISCGGGVILNEENILFLKQNGNIYFLDRPLELLKVTNDRPLSDDKNKLKNLYDRRYELYVKYSDYQIDNSKDIKTCVNKIKEIYNNENPSY